MNLRKIFIEISAILSAVIVSVPLYLIIINSLKSNSEILLTPMAFPTFAVGLTNITRAFAKMDILHPYATTISIAGIAVVIGIFFASLAAYAVARIRHRLFANLYWVYMAGIMIPIQSALIPLVFLLRGFGLNNTLFGISIVYTAIISPFAIFVFSGFMKTIPKDLEEAAYIDGCSPFRAFFQIIFPLIKPVTATLIILQFIYVWNDLLLPLVLVSTKDYPTVSIALYKFFGSRGQVDFTLLFGGISLVLFPILVLFFSFQRFFVKGLASGAVKG